MKNDLHHFSLYVARDIAAVYIIVWGQGLEKMLVTMVGQKHFFPFGRVFHKNSVNEENVSS